VWANWILNSKYVAHMCSNQLCFRVTKKTIISSLYPVQWMNWKIYILSAGTERAKIYLHACSNTKEDLLINTNNSEPHCTKSCQHCRSSRVWLPSNRPQRLNSNWHGLKQQCGWWCGGRVWGLGGGGHYHPEKLLHFWSTLCVHSICCNVK
jgi:hypothetical protein